MTEGEIDRAIGARIRGLRISKGITQEALARAVGVTFQQIQKYEKGTNRVGASRLVTIARHLGTPAAHFLDVAGPAPDASGASHGTVPASGEVLAVVRLGRLVHGIADEGVRRSVLAVLGALSTGRGPRD